MDPIECFNRLEGAGEAAGYLVLLQPEPHDWGIEPLLLKGGEEPNRSHPIIESLLMLDKATSYSLTPDQSIIKPT